MTRPAAVIVGLAITVLLFGGVAIIAVGRLFSDQLAPAAAPIIAGTGGPTATAPAPRSTPDPQLRELLPTVDDLVFDQAQFAEDYSYDSAGPRLAAGRCVSPGGIRELDAAAVARRDFSDQIGRSTVAAWVLEFDDDRAALRAAGQVSGLIQECLADFRNPNGPYAVSGGNARYGQVLIEVDSRTGLGTWEALGFVSTGSRLAVLDLTYRSTESHFEHSTESAEQTGLPLHPMLGTLPKVGERLRS